MDTLREILAPEFLLRNSVYMSLLIGLACPLVGVFLVLRRLVFLGLALPQVSSCGIACAFALHTWGIIPHMEDTEHGLAFMGSTVLTLLVLALLSLLERRGGGYVEGRIGTAYALAGAWSILLLVMNPYGEHGLLQRLRGEIIAVSDRDLTITAIAFGLVFLLLFLFRKELLLVSFDREMAVALRKNVAFWDALLFLVIGVTISLAVLSVGPLVTFGFLLIPALMAHLLARNIWQFILWAPAIGAMAALAGFSLAYRWEWPVGATDVALLGVLYLVVFLLKKALVKRPAFRQFHTRFPAQ
jgi:ABC-type Mn2+/Zn2+ transport system permease subunit